MQLGLNVRFVECANNGVTLARLCFKLMSVQNRYDSSARRNDPTCLKDAESGGNARPPNAQNLRDLFVGEQQFVLCYVIMDDQKRPSAALTKRM